MKSKLIDALDSVTWYNGLAEIILEWKKEGYLKEDEHLITRDWDNEEKYGTEADAQIQVIWMMCVEMFGDCGTSPRFGWIYTENKKQFHKFIDDITQTWRDYIESGLADEEEDE